jgi:amidophosphoribosyltransferase
MVEGKSVYEVRKHIGMELAREAPAAADMVIPVPDSGVPAALGYAAASGLPFELGIIRNHYVGRTFIEPSDRIRHLGVKLKHNANREKLKGKRIVLVDDSIVRGTTSKKIVEMVRDAGATEVHFRIASPPTTHSCFYGVDTPNREDLLAHKLDLEGMREFIDADSLAFVSIGGLYRAVGEERVAAPALASRRSGLGAPSRHDVGPENLFRPSCVGHRGLAGDRPSGRFGVGERRRTCGRARAYGGRARGIGR